MSWKVYNFIKSYQADRLSEAKDLLIKNNFINIEVSKSWVFDHLIKINGYKEFSQAIKRSWEQIALDYYTVRIKRTDFHVYYSNGNFYIYKYDQNIKQIKRALKNK